MREYRRDESRTFAAYETGIFLDSKKRSHFNNAGHIFLFGVDMTMQWERLYLLRKGKCESCGLPRLRNEVDADHKGKTPRTRCDCLNQILRDNSLCTGIRLRCTMDPRKTGFRPDSCHAKKHGREIISDRKARRDAAGNQDTSG